MPGNKKKCKFCGLVTRKDTTGLPNNPCPERSGALYACHVYERVRG